MAGMMSPLPFAGALQIQRELEEHVTRAGYPFGDILYSLLFFGCDFLPGLRLTEYGVMDVIPQRIVSPALPLGS